MYALIIKGFWWRKLLKIKIKIIMRKFISENKKGVLLGLAMCGFIFSSCALISVITVKSAIAVLLTLISIVCLGLIKELVYIKLK